MLFNIQGIKPWIVSATNAEGPPVPIPNTEVKLCSGENTLRETAREDSSVLTSIKEAERLPLLKLKNGEENYKPLLNGGVAQLGEHLPCKQGVMGSNPIISTSPEGRATKQEAQLPKTKWIANDKGS